MINPNQKPDPVGVPPTFGGMLPAGESEAPSEFLASLEDPPVQEDQGVSIISEGETRPGISGSAAEQRAAKTNFALGQDSPGLLSILNSIQNGTEGILRSQVANREDLKDREIKLAIIQEKAQKGQAITPEDVQFMSGMAQFDPKNSPETILERKYAQGIVNATNILGTGSDSVITNAYRKDPEGLSRKMSVAETLATRQEIVKSAIEDIEAIYQEQSWGGFFVDMAKGFVPFYPTWKLRSAAPEQASDALLKGSALDDLVTRYWSLPVDEMSKQLRTHLNGIAKDNPQLARELANALLTYTSSDKFLDNAFSVLDIVGFPGVPTAAGLAARGSRKAAEAVAGKVSGTVAKEAAEAVSDSTTLLKQTVQANGSPETKIQNQLNAMGDVDRAADVHIISKAQQILEGADPTGNARQLTREVPTLLRPEAIVDPTQAPNLHMNQVNDLVGILKKNSEEISRVITESVKVGRLPEEALQVAIRNEASKLQAQVRLAEDAILDVSWIRPDDSWNNVGTVSASIGSRERKLFDSARDAYQIGVQDYGLPAGSFKVLQQGDGFLLQVTRTIDETDPIVRASLLTEKNTHQKGLASTLFGWFRTADDRVPQHLREGRKALVHARARLEGAFRQARDEIGVMSSKATKELDLTMKMNKYDLDPITGERGRFFDTVQDFEQAFYGLHKKFPSAQQAKAYFTYRQFNDFDWMLRNSGVYRDRARQGIEKMILKDQMDIDGSTKNFTEGFFGKTIRDLPWNASEDASVVIHRSGQDATRFTLKTSSPDQKSQVQQLLKEGYKVVQIENPTRVPHGRRLGRETVNYIVTKDIEVQPLAWKQVPYRPGWHTSYPQEWYVKQPKLEYLGGEALESGLQAPMRHRFVGDTAVFAFDTEAEAIKYSQRMEQARKLYVSGDSGLDEFIRGNLPFTPTKFRQLFEAAGDTPAALDPKVPFHSTYTGRYTVDNADVKNKLRSEFENFEDTVRSQHNLFANVDKKFLGQRDDPLWTVDELGSELNPIHRLENAGEIDPILSVQKSMANIIRSREFSDYKIAHTEAWAQQFGHLIDGASIDDVLANPVHYVHNGQLVRSSTGNYEELRAAADSRRALVELLGTPSEIQGAIDWVRSKLMSSIFTDSGQGLQEKVRSFVYKGDRDPVSLMRSSAFHMNIGLFAPHQLFQNAMTMVNAMAIGGRHGLPGAMAGWPMRFALNNELLVDKMAQVSRGFGWTPEQFKESLKEFKRSGKNLIEGEHAWKDDVSDPDILKTKFGTVLDAGLVFFREGERLTRLASWNIAYREFRTANPDTVITDQIRRQLIDRSDLMSGNMTRASNAQWQQGLLAIPAQFISYHTRLAEQMLGKRLTAGEKARVIATNSVMYGLPIGLLGSSGLGALSAGQYPWHENVRTELLKKGFDVNDTMVDGLTNGIVGLMSSVIAGGPTDLSTKVGPGGGQLFKNMLSDDKDFLGILLGASGSKTGSVWQSLDPVSKWVLSPFRGDDEQFPLRPEDVLGVLRNIKSVDAATNIYYAYNYGKLFAKNNTPLTDDYTTRDAVFTALTGGTSRNISDGMLERSMNIDRTKMVNQAMLRAGVNMNAMADALLQNDHTTAATYRTRMAAEIALADLTVEEKARVIQAAVRASKAKLDQARYDFIWKDAPASQAPARQDQYLKGKQ